ncbi:hypothetical protein ACFCXF_24905 [Streptomyces virginiae]|uniref:hypothetical protein n=1 Tax=Streptomyces virginiae TaxID=1961 RepID=UPI001FCB38C2|nr:hypothetical protein [Streptomyces virginiae]
MTSWKSATRSPIAAFPSPSTSRTPPSGQACAVADGAGALRSGAGLAVALTAVGPGAVLGAGGVEHPAAPATTPASAPAVTRARIRRLVRRFVIIR